MRSISCIDNKLLTDKMPRGNGTLCRVLDFKLKHNAPSYKYKPNNPNEHQDPNTHTIPTLHETARKDARLKKQKLDEKQYIAYEMIACTFLLGLVQDGNDPNKLCIHAWDKPWEVLPLSK